MWEFIQKYLNSTKEFEIRFAVIIMLDYYINEEYINRVLEQLDKINSNEYYVKMAIAWTLQVAYVKQKEKTKTYLKRNNLDRWTYNKAIQKMLESNRISKEEKERLKKLKRNN